MPHVTVPNAVFAIVCFLVVAVLALLGYLRYQHRLHVIGRLEKLVETADGEYIYEGIGKGEVQRQSRLAVVQRMHRVGLCGVSCRIHKSGGKC